MGSQVKSIRPGSPNQCGVTGWMHNVLLLIAHEVDSRRFAPPISVASRVDAGRITPFLGTVSRGGCQMYYFPISVMSLAGG